MGKTQWHKDKGWLAHQRPQPRRGGKRFAGAVTTFLIYGLFPSPLVGEG